MPRLLAMLCGLVVALGALAAPAHAKPPKRKVRIESDPPGATVYVGAKKSGARGTTPVTLDLPVGEQTLIIELDGYLAHVESVSVTAAKGKAAKTPQKFSFALDKAVGTIRLHGLPDGAKVTLDGGEVSTMDDKVDVEPGAHELVVSNGGDRFDQWVEVDAGQEKSVEIKFGAGGGGGGDGTEGIEHHAEPEGPKEHASHPWYGTVGASYEVGWRRFAYDNLMAGSQQKPFDANGIGMVTFWGEISPWRSSPGMHALWPLSIIAGFGVGFPVTATDPSGKTADTYWRTTEAGLRWHWNVTHELGLDFEGGWARLLYTFRDVNNDLVNTIPDVDYETVRLGLRGVVRVGKGRTWIGLENRVVLSGGQEEQYFNGASAQGLGARAGFDVPFAAGRVLVRVEGNLSRYTWTFQSMPGDMNIADGATDTLWGFNVGLGGSY